MSRTLYIKVEIDWEDCEDISDEILFDDFCDSCGLFPKDTEITLVGSDKGIDAEEFDKFYNPG